MRRRFQLTARTRAFVACAASSICALVAGASCSSFRTTNGDGSEEHDASPDAPAVADDAGVLSDGSQGRGTDGGAPDAGSNQDSAVPGDAGEGGVCTESACPVTTVISGLYGPAALATDSLYVYWLEVGTAIPEADGSGEFVRLPKDATCTDRSCVEVLDPYALAGTFEGQYIYDNLVAINADDACYSQSFNAQAEHAIYCFPLLSLTKTAIDEDYGDCNSLWAGPGSMVWSLASSSATTSDGSIRERPLSETDGGHAPVVAGNRPNPTSVLADGTGVVWAETGLGDAGGAVLVAEPDGGVSPLASGRGGPVAVAEFAGYVYWIDATSRTISRTPRAGGGVVDQIANTDANPFALAVDATGVYWAAAGLTDPEGSVSRAPLGPGGPTTVMMSNVVAIQALAVDTTQVLVAAVGASVSGGGSIVAIDKTH